MNTIRCDNCGVVAPVEGLVHWLHLERIGIDVRAWPSDENEWHFCTMKCNGEWAQDRWLREKVKV